MSEWQFREMPQGKVPAEWAQRLHISPLLLEVLWGRGLDSCGAIDEYLNADLKGLTPSERWPQVPEAAAILVDELLAGRRLLVWGDYDADGITGTTLVLDVLEAHGIQALWHIPDRIEEGYGVKLAALQRFLDQDIGVLLTVDCGISDHAAVSLAREYGVTVVVTDHHLPPSVPVEANAICNPRTLPPEDVPCPHLAGVGVAFYLMAAVNNLLERHTGKRYVMGGALDLVALGTIADVMELKGENRILVRGGLVRMANAQRPGVTELKRVCRLAPAAPLTAGHVAFRIGPRINAAGRMGSVDVALRLLRTRDNQVAAELAGKLDALNVERRRVERCILAEASELAGEQVANGRVGLVLYGAAWNAAVVGNVASRIAEMFHRPVILFCDGREGLRGSGRSVEGFHLYGELVGIGELMLGFGGHSQAAGVTLNPAKLDDFAAAFDASARKALGDDPQEPPMMVERQLGLDKAAESGFRFLRELALLEPFGCGNPEPVFVSPPLQVKDRQPLGRAKENIHLYVEDAASGVAIPAKCWRMGDVLGPDVIGRTVRLAYTLGLDTYNGVPGPGLTVLDYRFEDGEGWPASVAGMSGRCIP